MTLAISDEHVELGSTARRWLSTHAPVSVTRRVLEAETDSVPPWWPDVAGMGWLGLAVGESNGGQGFGVAELCVVLEETGRVCLPGPLMPTAAAALALDRWSDATALARGLATGVVVGAVALGSDATGHWDADSGTLTVSGQATAWSAGVADVVLLPVRTPEGDVWCAVDLDTATIDELPSFDPTRRLAAVRIENVVVGAERQLRADNGAASLIGVLAAAEALGVAAWCVDTAAEHARTRVQFGRPIGQFQAVKHRVADMLLALEAARAAVWDAARALDAIESSGTEVAVGAALALAPDAAFGIAKDCIQVLGGIGYTWEHDAHIFLKRATSVRHQLAPPAVARRRVAEAVSLGQRRPLAVDLPAFAETVREAIRNRVVAVAALPKAEWNSALADSGLLVPHWPKPWGLDSSAIEQLVIDEELAAAGIRRRHLQVAGWALPTIIGHGTPEQQERWVPPSLRGEISWCQMFSEPDAGSDLASLTTRADRADGGWLINGQKVWAPLAQQAQWAICLARTDASIPRHEGISCFLVDMTTAGIDIRPLRELTGMAMFNEVFLTDVFVPDDCMIGPPGAGWECARTTLANERVSMSSGSSFGPGVASLFDLAERLGVADDPLVLDRLGGLAADSHAIAMLGVRTTLRALAGDARPGPEASVRKLLGVQHEQQIQDVGLDLLGPSAAVVDGDGAAWTAGFLGNRALSIAGGTSEIQKNVIAERLLGLPKDP